ncbi:HlyD family secretion protein [Flagellimonas sp.]|uniref:HlyD family secretion protein n=1 Tax=Flagellimonas sp. TaxID=2058762 RepID=UPI003AB62E70
MKANNKKWNIMVMALALFTVLVAVMQTIRYFVHASGHEDTNDAQVESYINPVSARVGGYIKKVYFEEHALVRRGDTLLVLEDIEFKAKKEVARAALMAAEANLEVLDKTILSAKTATLVDRNKISTAKANLWKQRQDLERYKKLLEDEAVTQSDYEHIKTNFEIAESNFEAASNGLRTSVTKISELESKRGLLKADIDRAKANLELAEINLSYTTITSPFTGYTGRKGILEGQQVQPGQSLVSVVNENNKWVIANFKETQLKGMYVGQRAAIEIDAFPDEVFEGEIMAIAAATGSEFSLLPSDNSAGNFVKVVKRVPVKIIFKGSDLEKIKSGMNVHVSVEKQSDS